MGAPTTASSLVGADLGPSALLAGGQPTHTDSGSDTRTRVHHQREEAEVFTVRVRDVMTAPAITVAQGAPFKEVVDLMLRRGVGALPVVDDTGDLLGMISEADLIARPAHGGRRRGMQTAAGMMSAPAECVHLDDTVRDVARRMLESRRKHFPVLDGSRRPVGIVSRRDLLRMFDRRDAELAAEVSDALGDDRALMGHAISVTARDGVVTIEGTVRRADDVAYVRRLAWMVPCVVDVVCHLTVAEPTADDGAVADDRPAADEDEPGTRRIVVGVDGSAASGRALRWAVAQAQAWRADVEVVHAWTMPDMGRDPLAQALADPQELEAQARRELCLVLDGAEDAELAAPVFRTLVRDDPASAILEAGKDADLVVVGARGLGVDGEADLGAVSNRVIREAQCPVVVVPAD
jgi:CBS domain-containing protein/nucleotide-binding universal stress UspA family protein